jgi:trans-aconitate 2-methyltransferase
MEWDPQKYVEYADYRNRPFFDLTGRIAAREPTRVVDLGCGPGVLTAALAERWPAAAVTGVDSSPAMIRQAQQRVNAANLNFVAGDLREWELPENLDVLVSNAALQWVPGHQDLMRSWLRGMKPGGWLAVQVPGNFAAPSHALMRMLAGSATWRDRLAGVLRHEDAVSEPQDYLALLLDEGCEADVWETTYQQVLHGADPVLEWVRGTGLRPILAALPAAEAAEFESEYATLLREAYPAGENGTVFGFRRIFAVGRKSA